MSVDRPVLGGAQTTRMSLVRWRTLFQFICVTMIASSAHYARTALGPLQESIRIALNLSDNQIALIQGPALAVPLVLTAVPVGLLVDRWSRVRLLLLFAACDAGGTLLTAVAPGLKVMFVARCLIGLSATAISTTAFSLVADLYAPAKRGRATMVMAVAQYGGMAAAFAFGGELLGLVSPSGNAWRWAMLYLSAPLVIVTCLAIVMFEPPRTEVAVKNPALAAVWPELWRLRHVFVPILAGIVMAEIAGIAVLVWAPPTLSRVFAISPERTGNIMATVLLLSGVVGPFAGGILADFCQRSGGPHRTLAVVSGLALLSAPAGLFAMVHGVELASVLLVTFMTLIGAIATAGTALFSIVIPNELRGLCVSILVAVSAIFGAGLAPLMVSTLSGYMGGADMIGRALGSIASVGSLLGAILFASGIRYMRHARVF